MKDEATCKGSWIFGSACGSCSKCKEEMKDIFKTGSTVITTDSSGGSGGTGGIYTSNHCCVCSGVCYHIGPATYCSFHNPWFNPPTITTPLPYKAPLTPLPYKAPLTPISEPLKEKVKTGWICPKCDKVFSPSVTECTYCNKK